MAGLTFNGTSGKLEFAASPGLDLSTGANTICWMAQTTAADTAWQCPISGETSGHSSRWSIERAIGTGTGGAGNPVKDSVTYQKATSADAVWTGATSTGPPANDSGALKWLLADGLMFGWHVKPGAGSSQGFCKLFTGSGSTWTEKTLSPQNYTFQIGDGTALGVGGLIVVGAFESSDWFKGDIHLIAGSTTPLTSAAINTLMTTKTTAAIIASFAAGSFLADASNALATDLIGSRTRSTNTGTSAASAVSSSLWTFGATSPDATVTAVVADATGAAAVPAVSASSTITAPTSLATGAAPVAVVSAGANSTVTAVVAAATGDTPNAVISAGSTITGVAALALGSAPPANQIVSAVVNAPAALALGSAPAASVSGGGSATVTAVPATGLGSAPIVSLSAAQTVAGVVALALGSAPAAVVTLGASVTAVPAIALGMALRPSISPAPPGGAGTAAVAATFAEDGA